MQLRIADRIPQAAVAVTVFVNVCGKRDKARHGHEDDGSADEESTCGDECAAGGAGGGDVDAAGSGGGAKQLGLAGTQWG